MKLIFTLSVLIALSSCQESFSTKLPDEVPLTDSPVENPTYRAPLAVGWEPNDTLASYEGKGTCKIDQITIEVIYEKTDLSYEGIDYCIIQGQETIHPESNCDNNFNKIDFSLPEPELIAGGAIC